MRRGPEDVRPFGEQVAAFAASLHNRLQRDAVGSGSCRASPRMTNRSAAELQDRIIAKNGHKLRHVPNMNATRSHGEHARHGKPRLIEVMAWAVFNFGDICCA